MIAHEINILESRRQEMQTALDALKSASERNKLGQFATPNPLAIEIARCVSTLLGAKHGKIHFADPSIGTGSFYSAARAVFGGKRMGRATGIELDEAFACAARELWSDSGLEVLTGDFTRIVARSPRPTPPNVILANPPYVRHHHLSREDKDHLKALVIKLTGIEINGLAGLYVYFLLLATAWMEEDGVAAWLIPSEFMDVNYGAALKEFLTDQVTLLRIHRFDPDDVQFGDALVSSAVVIFRKAVPPAGHAAEFTFGGTLEEPGARELVTRERLRESRKWTAYPCHAKNNRQTLGEVDGPTLGDFFRVQRGIATGCNKFFILDRDEARRLELPDECLRPILPSPRHLKTTVIERARDGYPRLDRQLCLVDCALPESAVAARYPTLWKYLQTAQSTGVMDGYLVTKRSPWYKQEQREPTPFLCTYMGRGTADQPPFRFIWNRSNAIGTNLYLMLYPRNGLAAMLKRHPERAEAVHALLGQVTGNEMRGEGRVYGGGLNKIEPSELARISAGAFVSLWPKLTAAPEQQRLLFT